MNLEEIRLDISIKQKKGLHFILTSVVLWSLITYIHFSPIHILTKNFYTFCATSMLLPLAYLVSKWIKIDFSSKGSPLSNLGILFSINQMLYLLIAMWVYSAVPEKMVMVLAMIFGAHLLPFGWLYQSKSYTIFSVIVPIAALFVGSSFPSYVVAGLMIIIEIIFSLLLVVEIKGFPQSSRS